MWILSVELPQEASTPVDASHLHTSLVYISFDACVVLVDVRGSALCAWGGRRSMYVYITTREIWLETECLPCSICIFLTSAW